MLTTEQLDDIRERCEKATTGPWKYYVDCSGAYIASNAKEFVWSNKGIVVQSPLKACPDDSIFIAHAREDVPALLEMINELHDRTGTYISMGAHLKLCSEFKRMKERCEYLESELRQCQGGPPEDIHPEYGFGK